MSKDGIFYTEFSQLPTDNKSYLFPSMFPPTEEEEKKIHLERW